MDITHKKIYIVVSQSRSIVSRVIRALTAAKYSHVSVTPYPDLRVMYSFGRRLAYFPFWGGLVCESTEWGTYKRFSDVRVIVLEARLSEENYDKTIEKLDKMWNERKTYKYNYIGAFLSLFKTYRKFKNRYYCSEFVREILETGNVDGVDKLSKTVHPEKFLKVPEFVNIYEGQLCDYVYNGNCQRF